jgi:hypothetical protein
MFTEDFAVESSLSDLSAGCMLSIPVTEKKMIKNSAEVKIYMRIGFR